MEPGTSMLRVDMFKHYDKMNTEFLVFLEQVLDGAGLIIPRDTWITSDWRDPAQEVKLPGGVPTSLHPQGRAVDLHSLTFNATDYGNLSDSICLYRKARQAEYEIEITPGNQHVHIGLFSHIGPLRLIVRCAHN